MIAPVKSTSTNPPAPNDPSRHPAALNHAADLRKTRHTLRYAVQSLAVLCPALRSICLAVVEKFITTSQAERAKLIVEAYLGATDDYESWLPMAGLVVKFVESTPATRVGPPLAGQCRFEARACYDDALSRFNDSRRAAKSAELAVVLAAAAIHWQHDFDAVAGLAESLLRFDRNWAECRRAREERESHERAMAHAAAVESAVRAAGGVGGNGGLGAAGGVGGQLGGEMTGQPAGGVQGG